MSVSFMEMNLLPSERVSVKYSFGLRVLIIGLCAGLIVMFGFLGWTNNESARSTATTLANVEANQVLLQQQLKMLQGQLNHEESAQIDLQGNSNLLIKPFIGELMTEMPNGVSWTDISISGNSVTLNGTTQKVTDVADFENNLIKMNSVSTAYVGSISNSAHGSFVFTLTINLNGGNGK